VTTPLSPAAQAVRNAYHEICEDYIETWLNFNHNRGLAAVLRAAAADRVVPEQGCQIYGHPRHRRRAGGQCPVVECSTCPKLLIWRKLGV
jgi:hypothetical protein